MKKKNLSKLLQKFETRVENNSKLNQKSYSNSEMQKLSSILSQDKTRCATKNLSKKKKKNQKLFRI
jgi:hypothetical protein